MRLTVNGNPVDFSYQVLDGDQVEVFSFLTPEKRSLHAGALCELSHPRFILDNHLGKLASYLRMLGFDCLYRNDYQDAELAQLSQAQNRILLTRDHRLLMRKEISQGYWLRSQDPTQQLQEVVRRFALAPLVKPFQRCMVCNALLEPVSKEAVLHRLQPLTIKYFDVFRLCPSCDQVYWPGSHYTKMLAFIENTISHTP
jgi:hypothetical protein